MTVVVFANGDLESPAWAGAYLAQARAIIAADGGALHVLAAGYRPDVIVGDLDSLPQNERPRLEATGSHFVTHPDAKDETDLELALLYAVEHYDDPVLVFAGLGGRLDQMLANVLLLLHPALSGRAVRFVTPYQELWLLQNETEIGGEAGDTVSLIPIGGDVHVIATTGLKWPLQNEILAFGPARGISNVMTGPTATVKIGRGHLLCVHTTRHWNR